MSHLNNLVAHIKYPGGGEQTVGGVTVKHVVQDFIEDGPEQRETLTLSWKKTTKVWMIGSTDKDWKTEYYRNFKDAIEYMGQFGGTWPGTLTISKVDKPEGAKVR